MRGPNTYKKVLSPAKLNLWLKIGAPRADGFHPLESLMLPVNWGDSIEYRLRSSRVTCIQLQMTALKALKPEQNLAYRAAMAFSRAFKCGFELDLRIKKKIPAGAGLGGGSSNAASVLKILAQYFHIPLTSKTLHQVAIRLGADVPVFLQAKPSWCEGIGEKIEILKMPRVLDFVIVVSRKHPVPTPWAYRSLDQTRPKTLALPGMPKWLREDFQIPALENDFENLVLRAQPRFLNLKKAIASSGALAACMSGSGSAFFGVYASERLAKKGAQKLLKDGYEAVSCRSLSL